MSALKIVCKRKISRRLRLQSYHLFGGEIIFEVFQSMCYRRTNRRSDGRYTVTSLRGKTRETKCRRYYRYRRYLTRQHSYRKEDRAMRPIYGCT